MDRGVGFHPECARNCVSDSLYTTLAPPYANKRDTTPLATSRDRKGFWENGRLFTRHAATLRAQPRVAQSEGGIPMTVGPLALHSAHRTSTASSCAFCEQEGHLATSSPSFSGRAFREHRTNVGVLPILSSWGALRARRSPVPFLPLLIRLSLSMRVGLVDPQLRASLLSLVKRVS